MKKITTFLLALLLVSGLTLNVVATENLKESSDTAFSSEILKAFEFVDNKAILGGEDIAIYPTFKDQDEAIAVLYNEIPNYLEAVAVEGCLVNLSEQNWEEHVHYSIVLKEKNDIKENYRDEEMVFESFIDIFENDYQNRKIKEYIAEMPQRISLFNANLIVDELSILLPYTSTLSTSRNRGMLAINATATFNLSNAIAYASAYATTPNGNDFGTKSYWYFDRGDCANFTSQILEAGGVKQNVYTDRAKGWWHTITPYYYQGQVAGYTHTHAEAWSMADTFARYMGMSTLQIQ